MSKKKKAGIVSPPVKSPAVAAPTRPPVVVKTPISRPTPALATPAVDVERGFELIRFDKRVKWLTSIVTGLFLILVLSKIHFSSIPYWNQVIPDGSDAKRGLVAGKPRAIRMDEWAAMSPFILSQANNGYPQENPAIGGEKPGLVAYLPISHFVTVFRPIYWGFTFFGYRAGVFLE